MNYKKDIVEFCLENRVSTTEVADALGKSGVLPSIGPINQNLYRVGPVKTIFTAGNSNYAVHEQVENIEKGDIVIIFTDNCKDRAIIGDLIAKYALLYKGAAALVVEGLVRDAASLRRQGYAIWSQGVTPLGCFNTPSTPYPQDKELNLRSIFDGGVAVCDDGGVTVIPSNQIDADMLNRLQRIEMQEDIWFFCLDTLKWSTKKIVCEKAYLTEQNLLSTVHVNQLIELSKTLEKQNTN